jgi:hypothetical protein
VSFVTPLPIDHPDWMPSFGQPPSKVVDQQDLTMSAGDTRNFTYDIPAGTTAMVVQWSTNQVASLAVEMFHSDGGSMGVQVVAQDMEFNTRGLILPFNTIAGRVQVTLIAGSGVNVGSFYDVVGYLNASADVIRPPALLDQDLYRTIPHGTTTPLFAGPITAIFDRITGAYHADAASTLEIHWTTVATGVPHLVTWIETVGSPAANAPLFFDLPIRAAGATLHVTNPGGADLKASVNVRQYRQAGGG